MRAYSKGIPLKFLELFNEESYLKANLDVTSDLKSGRVSSAIEHFVFYGYDEIVEGKRRLGATFPFMKEAEYIEANLDVKRALEDKKIKSGYWHFFNFGYMEFITGGNRKIAGSYPSVLNRELKESIKDIIDLDAFYDANSDIEKRDFDYFLENYLEDIRLGKRAIHPQIPPMSELEYIFRQRDIVNALYTPFEHFLLHGYKEILSGKRAIEGAGGKNIYLFIPPKITPNIEKEIENFRYKPLISIIMPVFNVEPKWLDLAIKSLEAQWYENWELCIADDKSTNPKTIEYLKKIDNPKIKVKFLEKNLNISGASNEALTLASGEYLALMDNDDELATNALYEVIKAINDSEAEFIYSDEDKIDLNNRYIEPHFKPDFAPDTFLSQNYISHLTVIKSSLVKKVGGWSKGLEGAQDYDLYLKVLEHTNKIAHIPKILYHWRKIAGSTAEEFSSKDYAQKAGREALSRAIKRRGIKASVKDGILAGTYKVEYELLSEPLISIIIPFKDKPELLRKAIGSILEKSTYKNFEIIAVNNNSEEEETFEAIKELDSLDKRVTFIDYDKAFNFSAINNYAVNCANGEHIVLMNNDIEIITPNWIEELLMHSQRESIGVVGAKLYYPNDTIQHAGVIVGLGGVAGHSHKHYKRDSLGYFGRLVITQNLLAVTAALFMVKRDIYDELNGLDEENLSVAFNDVDFCLRAYEKGYLNLFTPYCEAYHYESISRGYEDTPQKVERFNKEVEYMKRRHKEILEKGDPFYNPNLTLDREDFSLK